MLSKLLDQCLNVGHGPALDVDVATRSLTVLSEIFVLALGNVLTQVRLLARCGLLISIRHIIDQSYTISSMINQ